MKAIVRLEYGSPDVLELEEIEKPKVGDDDVLVKVQAASVNASDIELLTAHPLYVRLVGFGFWKPKVLILGSDIAMVGGGIGSILRVLFFGPWISKTGTKKMGILAVKPNKKDLASVTELVAEGKLKSVIDRRYPLSEVAETLRYLGAGHARGKLVITM